MIVIRQILILLQAMTSFHSGRGPPVFIVSILECTHSHKTITSVCWFKTSKYRFEFQKISWDLHFGISHVDIILFTPWRFIYFYGRNIDDTCIYSIETKSNSNQNVESLLGTDTNLKEPKIFVFYFQGSGSKIFFSSFGNRFFWFLFRALRDVSLSKSMSRIAYHKSE